MIDINFIRENSEKVKEGIKKKQYDPSIVDTVLEFDRKRRKFIQRVEELRAERNKIGKEQSPQARQRGKEIKEELKEIEPELNVLTAQYEEAIMQIPNLPFDNVPIGVGEKDNRVIREWGKKPAYKFTIKDHLELAEQLDLVDFETGSKVAGSGFYYLKNDGVLLELALVRYGLDFLIKRGYTPFLTPDLAREKFYVGTGYLPKGPEEQTYTIENYDLGLIATSEVTLAGLHADGALSEKELPKKYAGYSHCFRVEAGSYGKYAKGLYRVHQFTKIEMFVYSLPEESQKIHEELLKNEEDFWQSLGIPYRVLEMCTGDLGAQAARKYDIEAWMPGRGEYGEVTSTSNTTDFQARRLNVKYRQGNEMEFMHTLNGTLVATPRAIVAILENYQQEDSSVVVPEVLRPYMGKDKISPRV